MTHELSFRVEQAYGKMYIYMCHQPQPGGFGELDMWMTPAEYERFRKFMTKFLAAKPRKLAEQKFAFGKKGKA